MKTPQSTLDTHPDANKKQNKLVRQTLKDWAKPAKKMISYAWLFSIISTIIFIAQAWLLASIFAHWLNQSFTHQALSLVGIETHFLVLVICLLLRPLCNYFKEKFALDAGLSVASTLRQQLLQRVQQLGAARHQYGNDGELTSYILQQSDSLVGYVSRFHLQRLVVVTTPILLLIAAFSQSWVATAVMLMTAPLIPIFMILIGHATAKKSREQFQALAQMSGRFLDWLRGVATLQRIDAVDIARADLQYASEQYRRRTMDVLKIAFLNSAALELLAALSIALLAMYLGFGLMGILPWQKNEIAVPYQSALFLLLLAPEFYLPLRQLGADYHVKAQAEGAVENLLPLLQQTQGENEILENQSNHQYMIDIQTLNYIEFKQVTVYGLNQRTRLSPTDFTLKQGEQILLLGESGSGKSTLLQIFMGFCDYQGSISLFLNQASQQQQTIDFKHIDKSEFRKHIAYLSQTSPLLAKSIAENLRLVKADASDDELWQVLEWVQLKDLIAKLPLGINTPLGERGQGLSGGQQRRLAIAQLLLQDATIWLLDEPTEHLDEQSAIEIAQLLQQLTQGKTVLWVSHDTHGLDWLQQKRLLDLQKADLQGEDDEK
ncbi:MULTISPECIES: thiol reductant ABC exporter subunit CydD [unclassified Acinetobacter]